MLLSGLTLASIPIIIYLIHRQRLKVIEWAAMQFLLEIVEEQKRFRIEELILLLLRVLMLLFLALAVARPALSSGAMASLIGNDGDALMILDSTFSMATRQGARTRYDAARERAQTVIDGLPQGFGISLINGSTRPDTVIGSYSTDHELVKQTVKSMKPTSLSGKPESMLQHAKKVLKDAKNASKSIFLISDFQREDWETPSEAVKSAIADLGKDNQLVFVPVGDAIDYNLSVAQLSLVQGAVREGQTAYFEARIENQSPEKASSVPVDFVIDGETVDSKSIDVPANQFARIFFSQAIAVAGPHRAILRIGEDANPADNTRYLAFDAHESLKVLAVLDQDPVPGTDKPTDFVELCLNPLSRRQNGSRALYQFTHISAQDLLAVDLSEYELIVMANVSEVSKVEAERLEEFAKNGGGILMFLGQNVDPEGYNAGLYRDGNGLFPWALAPEKMESESRDRPLVFRVTAPEHPVWDHIVEEAKNYMDTVRFYEAFGFVEGDPERGLTLATGKVQKQFEDSKAMPMIVEFKYASGRAIVVGTSADLSWNNFAARPAFVAFIQQAVKRLRMPRRGKRSYVAGDHAERRVEWKYAESEFQLLEPDDSRRSISALQDQEGYVVNIGEVSKAGFYRMTNSADAGDVREFTVNVDNREGNISTMGAEELKKVYSPLGVTVDNSADLSAAFQGIKTAADFSTYCLLIVLLCWIGENLLAHRIARRQQ